ncbi:hypothetical protein CR513_09691, partial [Mucuna pruriens]
MWEGPFRILEEVGLGAYCLEHLGGKKAPRTWNYPQYLIHIVTIRNHSGRSDKPDNERPERPAWGHEEIISLITDGRKGQPGGTKRL